jgi:hypothetical protein
MASEKQRAAARRNVTKTPLGKEASKVRKGEAAISRAR